VEQPFSVTSGYVLGGRVLADVADTIRSRDAEFLLSRGARSCNRAWPGSPTSTASPVGLPEIIRLAVLAAIAEHDQLGSDAHLAQYGPSRLDAMDMVRP
jgi:hypothetical protein